MIHAFPWLDVCFVGDTIQEWTPPNVHYVLADMGVAADTSISATTIPGAEKEKRACVGDTVAAAGMGTNASMPTMTISSDLTTLCPSNSVVISPVTNAGMETTASTHMTKVMNPLEDERSLQVEKAI